MFFSTSSKFIKLSMTVITTIRRRYDSGRNIHIFRIRVTYFISVKSVFVDFKVFKAFFRSFAFCGMKKKIITK